MKDDWAATMFSDQTIEAKTIPTSL
jgi:hypothetical protein